MSLTEYIRRLAKRWRVILSTLLVFVSAVGVYSLTALPTYESTARVFVSTSSTIDDLSGQLAAGVYAQQRVLSYAAVAESVPMAQAVARTVDFQVNPQKFADQISTTVEYGTVLIHLSARANSPYEAKDLLDAIVRNYNSVLRRIDSSRGEIDAIQISVVDEPTLPAAPVSPRLGLNLLFGLLAGLLVGIAAAALRDVVDDTVGGEDELEALGITTLGRIPKSPTKYGRNAAIDLVEGDDRSAQAEAFRQLRLNLRFASLDRPPKSILVTSANPGDGKTYISAKLASVYASAGASVVLVDLDLRRPSVASIMGLEQSVGVMSVLIGKTTLQDAIQVHGRSGVAVLASGPLPPNPADILNTEVLAQLLKQLGQLYDVVILDSPPATIFVDAREISPQVDGVILLSRWHKTKLRQLDELTRQLERAGARLLGTVINKEPSRGTGVYASYYRSPSASEKQGRGGRRRG